MANSCHQTVLPRPNYKDKVKNQISALCKEKNAIILAHYYQEEEIQDIADFIGDSLELSRKAAETKAEYLEKVL